MLRDLTIGQHFTGNRLVHEFDPRLKLVLTIAYIILLFAHCMEDIAKYSNRVRVMSNKKMAMYDTG